MERETWLEPEERCYPRGGMARRARVRIARNKHNAIDLPYGELRIVRAGIPDTAFTVPARLRYRGRTVRGYIAGADDGELDFRPEASDGVEHEALCMPWSTCPCGATAES